MEILLVTAYGLFFIFIIRKSGFFAVENFKPWLLPAFFILKCVAGILLGLIYTHYYVNHSDADTFKFFTDSKFIFDTLWEKPYDFFRMFTGIHAGDADLREYYVKMDSWLNTSPLYNDNRTMIRMNTLFRFFSLGYYNVHVVFLNFVSFTGLYCIYKALSGYLPGKKMEFAILIFLMPSLLFWGSGLLKDGLLITAAGALLLSYQRMMSDVITFKRSLTFLLSLFILAFIKVYVTVILLPGLFAWFITRNSSSKKVFLTFIAIYTLYFITAFNLYHVRDEWNVAALLFYKQKNFIEIGMYHNAKMIPVVNYECSGPGILSHSPQAFANTFLRPFIWETKGNPMVLLSALENVLLLLLIVAMCIWSDFKKRLEPVVMLSVIFVICLFTLIGLITPVLGAIVRYRIVGLPFLIFVILYYFRKPALFSKMMK
jgi:hypothetical protein